MTRFLPVFAILLSLPVAADHLSGPPRGVIKLQPGSTVNIDGTTVMCLGSSNADLPRCGVNPSLGTSYEVRVGGSLWGTVSGFETALAAVKQLKESGLCN
jgi:hypothetical protein